MYGVLATFFYPLVMQHTGFTVYGVLSVLWVWIYGSQAWYMLSHYPRPTLPLALFSSLWALLLLSITLTTNSFDYLAIAALTLEEKTFLLIIGILTIVMSNATLLLHRLATVHHSPAR